MEKLLTGSIFGFMFKKMYNYYNLKNISHLLKTSIQLDTSYETVTKELNGKTVLLASSISQINKDKSTQVILNKSFIEPEPLKEFYFSYNYRKNNVDLSLSNFEAREISINFEDKKILNFDLLGLKNEVIKLENKLNEENYNTLSLFKRIRLYPIKSHEK